MKPYDIRPYLISYRCKLGTHQRVKALSSGLAWDMKRASRFGISITGFFRYAMMRSEVHTVPLLVPFQAFAARR